jgi:hypothetical protein
MPLVICSVKFLNLCAYPSINDYGTFHVLKLNQRDTLRLYRLNVQEIQLVDKLIDIFVCLQPEEILLTDYIQCVLRIIGNKLTLQLI